MSLTNDTSSPTDSSIVGPNTLTANTVVPIIIGNGEPDTSVMTPIIVGSDEPDSKVEASKAKKTARKSKKKTAESASAADASANTGKKTDAKTLHHCRVCNTEPDQKSHHDTHLKTEKHKLAAKVRRLELEKLSDEERCEEYRTPDIDDIMDWLEHGTAIVAKYKPTNEIVWDLDTAGANQQDIPGYAGAKAELDSLVKSCHQLLYNNGAIVGSKAQNDIMRILAIKMLEKEFNNPNSAVTKRVYEERKDYMIDIDALAEFDKYIKYAKNIYNFIDGNNNSDSSDLCYKWENFVSLFLKIVLPNIYTDDDTKFNCKPSTFKDLIIKISNFTITDDFINSFASTCGDVHEAFRSYAKKGSKELGQFFTPRNLINLMFHGLEIDKPLHGRDKLSVYDPCMGTGGFLTRVYNLVKEHEDIPNIAPEDLCGCEIENDTIKFGFISTMLTTDASNVNIKHCDSLCDNPFMLERKFDVIVTNPPFGTKIAYVDMQHRYEQTYGPSEVTKILKHSKYVPFDAIYPLKMNNGAGLFIQHCIYMLKDDGFCVIVLPDGELFEGNSKWSKNFRKWWCESVNILSILKVPGGTFEHAGVKTNVVVFRKNGATQRIKYLEVVDSSCKQIRHLFNVTKQDLIASNYCLDTGSYTENSGRMRHNVPMVKLDCVCVLETGDYIKKDSIVHGEYPVYGGGGISAYINKYNCENTIIIARAGISNNCVRYESGKFYLNDNGYSVKIINNNINKKYLAYYLLSIQENIYNMSCGSGQQVINKAKLYSIKIPLPSLEVQKQIVDELSRVESSINNLEKVLEDLKWQKDKYQQCGMKSQINKLLDNAEKKKLGDICEVETGEYIKKNSINPGLYPIYGGGGISEYINKYNREDNIIISRAGISKTCIRYETGKFYLNDNGYTVNITSNNIHKQYLACYLFNIQDKIYNLACGSGQQVINKAKLYSIKISIPSPRAQDECIEIWKEKEKYLNNLATQMDNYKKQINDYKNLANDIIYHYCN